MSNTDPLSLVNMILAGFAIPFGALLAGVVCLVYMRLSKGLLLSMVGFGGVAFFTFVNTMANRMVRVTSRDELQTINIIHAGAYLVIAVMYLLITGGLVMAFIDVQKQLRRRSDGPLDSRDRLPPVSEARGTWPPQNQGSPDIQR